MYRCSSSPPSSLLFTLIVACIACLLSACQAPVVASSIAATPSGHRAALDARLEARLQTMSEVEQLPIALWAAERPDTPTQSELIAETLRIHPNGATSGMPWNVSDPALAAEIQATYTRLVSEAVAARADPLLAFLAQIGVDARFTAPDIPLVNAQMTKAQIEEAAASPLVVGMYLDDAVAGLPGEYPTPGTPTPFPPAQAAEWALSHVSRREDVPRDELVLVSNASVTYPTLGRSYQYVVVVHNKPGTVREFHLLVDLMSAEVEPDVAAIEQAERDAYAARYGKFEPRLHERLQTVGAEELLPIALWAAERPDTPTQSELIAETLRIHPNGATGGMPWNVSDPALAAEIQATYTRLVSEAVAARVDPLLAFLAQTGVDARFTAPDIPLVNAQMTKAQIEQAAASPLVATIYLDDAVSGVDSDMATATTRIPWLWQSGLSGSGTSVAIIEPGPQGIGGANIDAAAAACLNMGAVYNPALPDSTHQGQVASILGCDEAAYPGVAQGVTVVDGGYDPAATTFQTIVAWGVSNASILNLSVSLWPPGDANSRADMLGDRVVDYYSRVYGRPLIVAAGNTTGRGGAVGTTSVSSPGKGWNVITVGNLDDRNSAAWANSSLAPPLDVMYAGSSYVNPLSGAEKPDVAAPGTHIISALGPITGTSFAAPHVSGLVALLTQKNLNLNSRAASVRAILLASAVQNLRDSRIMPAGQDLADGAGGVNARLALETATMGFSNATVCDQPCWWDSGPVTILPNGVLDRQFRAVQGERIRVALAWYAYADALWLNHFLDHRFSLQVLGPGGAAVANGYSATDGQSEQLVEFVAPQTGLYTIRARRFAGDQYNIENRIGIAWAKDSTYLPDVRGSANGWNTTLSIRNDGILARPVRVTLLAAAGTSPLEMNNVLAPNAVWSVPPPTSFSGSAIVDGGQDLSVIAANEHTGPYGLGAYTGIVLPVATGYAPVVHRNNSGWYSQVFVQNASGVANSVDVHFFASVGNNCSPPAYDNYLIPAGGSLLIDLASANLACLGSTFVGSVYIASNNDLPIAVASTQFKGASFMEAESVLATANTVYAPLIQNRNPPGCSGNCWLASVNAQNTSVTAGTFLLTLRASDGAGSCPAPSGPIQPLSPWIVWPLPCTPGTAIASAELHNNTNNVVGANINQILENSEAASTYPAIASPLSRVAIVPRIMRQAPWNDAITVRNLSTSSQTVRVYPYAQDGTALAVVQQVMPAGGVWTIFLPDTASRSAVVLADAPIAVTANIWNAGQGGDNIGSYAAVHR